MYKGPIKDIFDLISKGLASPGKSNPSAKSWFELKVIFEDEALLKNKTNKEISI